MKLWRNKKFRLILALCGLLIFVYWFIPPVWRLNGGQVKVTQWHRTKGELTATVGPGTKTWLRANATSKHVLYSFVVAEDSRFYTHHGLDFYEIWKSFQLNLKKGRYIRGGSTITQQVVKMSFLSREKSIIRKAREAVGALILEVVLTKTQILEWYINLAEFGDGVYGIRAASRHYFETKPELLTIQQASHLALVLPSPNGWSVGLRRRNLTEFGHRRFASIINRLKVSGYITEELWLNSLATGNFGRPLNSYHRILARYDARRAQNGTISKEEIAEFVDVDLPWPVEDQVETPNQSTEDEPQLPSSETSEIAGIKELIDESAQPDSLQSNEEQEEIEISDSGTDEREENDDTDLEMDETSNPASTGNSVLDTEIAPEAPTQDSTETP